jgi:hypothetical protein
MSPADCPEELEDRNCYGREKTAEPVVTIFLIFLISRRIAPSHCFMWPAMQ